MLCVSLLQLAIVGSIVIYLTANMLRLLRLKTAHGPLPISPFVSICVPARNEERDIAACLRSLLAQDYPCFEVIAVDDNSTDATLAIMQSLAREDARLTCVQGEELPADWLGKPFALHQACRHAKGQYLLFTDADPIFAPPALTSAIYHMQIHDLDALSLMPGAVFGSFWEKTVQPVIFAFIAALIRFGKVNDPRYPDAMGIGAFLMFKRAAYERIGGHAAVRDKIVEDIELAALAKRQGCRLHLADAKDIFRIRMYHSLAEIRAGWRKNVFIALKKSVFWTLYYMTVIFCFQVSPYLLAIHGAATGAAWPVLAASLAALGLAVFTGAELCRELKLARRHVFLFPLGALVFIAIMADSMLRIFLTRTTLWRGRVYKA